MHIGSLYPDHITCDDPSAIDPVFYCIAGIRYSAGRNEYTTPENAPLHMRTGKKNCAPSETCQFGRRFKKIYWTKGSCDESPTKLRIFDSSTYSTIHTLKAAALANIPPHFIDIKFSMIKSSENISNFDIVPSGMFGSGNLVLMNKITDADTPDGSPHLLL